MQKKRLFIALEVDAPWQETYPSGRVLEPQARHLTLLFLGNQELDACKTVFQKASPLPRIAPVALLEKALFLPQDKPRVVAWYLNLLRQEAFWSRYRRDLVKIAKEEGFVIQNENRSFLPHVTIARGPFKQEEWQRHLIPLPSRIKSMQLYESLGNAKYKVLEKKSMRLPFEEFSHTADVAFLIRGESMQQLHLHAMMALAFIFPQMIDSFEYPEENKQLEQVIYALNKWIAVVDRQIGCPFKAVSFHGIIREVGGMLEWEMVIDV